MNNLQTRKVQAMDIPIGGIFIWQNTMYSVQSHDEECFVTTQALATWWTHNPYDRWQLGTMQLEKFNGLCVVDELSPGPNGVVTTIITDKKTDEVVRT